MGTDNGVSKYDGKAISKIQFTSSFWTAITQLSKNTVWNVFQDKSGVIWLRTSQDLYCYDGKLFSHFLDNKNISNLQNLQLKSIQCFIKDNSGIILMGSGSLGMESVIRLYGKFITSYKPNGDGWNRHMLKDKNETMWFDGRSNDNFVYNGKEFTHFTEKFGI